MTVNSGGVAYRVQLPPADQRESGMQVAVDYRPFTVEIDGRLGGPAPRPQKAAGGGGAQRAAAKGAIRAQIAGRILSVRVKPGDAVKAGDVLLILEAMKMENEIKSPAEGTVTEVAVAEGAKVTEGDTLVVVE
ncbi:MAG: biotin/lipoyl-binding protein [Dehalococcoidia bacterium]|nr:biotin/lipoyl-binding protein [Dehalococcoidia bacterium]